MLAVHNEASGAVYIKFLLFHEARVAEHGGTAHVAQEELTDGVGFIIRVGALTQAGVNVKDWNSGKRDAAEHNTE